ncbi:MAG: PEP-CTERM sorting domain-containing protein [Planctomycetota bacterium]
MNLFTVSTRFVAAAAIATAVSTTASAQIELLSNGGFESGLDDWIVSNANANATVTTTSDATEGVSAAVMTNSALANGLGLKQERFAVGAVSIGDEVTVSFDAKGSTDVGGVIFLQLFHETATGGASNGAGFLGPAPLSLSSAYTSYSYTRTIDTDVSGGLSILFAANTGGATGSFAEFFVDNVSVSIIPEPTSAALIGLRSLGLLARRRRQA